MVISLNCLGRAEADDLQSVLPALAEVAEQVDVPQARLGEALARLPEWTRVHLSSVAVDSLAVEQYSTYRGPGKIEGSIVNWLNGPLFQMVGERLGFHVALEPEELLPATAAA